MGRAWRYLLVGLAVVAMLGAGLFFWYGYSEANFGEPQAFVGSYEDEPKLMCHVAQIPWPRVWGEGVTYFVAYYSQAAGRPAEGVYIVPNYFRWYSWDRHLGSPPRLLIVRPVERDIIRVEQDGRVIFDVVNGPFDEKVRAEARDKLDFYIQKLDGRRKAGEALLDYSKRTKEGQPPPGNDRQIF